jgi:hypothetical protein
LPSHASDLLSARLQAIGGARTFTSQDSQRCQLLTNDAAVRVEETRCAVDLPWLYPPFPASCPFRSIMAH